jgi:F-type H+-transporting ATPase subunit gamma
MESAYNNLTSRLEQLQQDARQARQGEITAELLDVITGTEAQIGEAKPATRWS